MRHIVQYAVVTVHKAFAKDIVYDINGKASDRELERIVLERADDQRADAQGSHGAKVAEP